MSKGIAKTFISLVLLGTVLGACGGAAEKESKDQEAQLADASGYTTRTFDNYGREVVVTQKPSQVITLGPNATELFIALGLTDLIIGNSLDNHSRGALPEFAENYARVPELTYGPVTREAVITSGADFIYGIDWEFGAERLDVKELAELGIVSYMNSATTVEEMYQEIRDLGAIFQIDEAAERFIADQEARISAVQEKLEGMEPVNVLVYDTGGEGVFTAGKPNFETLLIELAGGRNIFDDITDRQWTTVSYEEVLKRQPDVILVHDYDVPSLEQKISEIQQHPALSQIESVQKGNFVTISLESVLPGNRIAYSVETLAQGFHPDLFK